MKKKKDCKECGSPLKDWQVKQDYDLCLECYNERKQKEDRSVHETLQEEAIKEEGEKEIKDENETKKIKLEEEEIVFVEKQLGEKGGHLEDDLQGEEEED